MSSSTPENSYTQSVSLYIKTYGRYEVCDARLISGNEQTEVNMHTSIAYLCIEFEQVGVSSSGKVINQPLIACTVDDQ